MLNYVILSLMQMIHKEVFIILSDTCSFIGHGDIIILWYTGVRTLLYEIISFTNYH